MIRVLENLASTDGNIDVEVRSDGTYMYAYFIAGDVSNLEVDKTYTYSITFRGKEGGYGSIRIDGAIGVDGTTQKMVDHTGDVQTVHFPVVRTNTSHRGIYLVARGVNGYEAGESIRLISCSVHEGEQGSDIYVPPHFVLTPEQIATLPPYGEYKEIKTF